ncbi:hypothetical protein HNQ68_003154 [Pseudochrobactrum saccharolyticum]|uniref:Uncharacterized protein n=1 Tax=Pseudochrobactrum saccharolyticum TaxID=354352 RepID=A0A7W8ERJ9_9HYPH|nr:hypothetical protein [Pseudochrobactrum saccharolyticum]KAB0537043.1 hypothetical protein F7P81_16585 [Pseudochrobactrum saccharolyticum]MBB5092597.1 hypothetical protein [Pseudochrobactrum saccharolyticum]
MTKQNTSTKEQLIAFVANEIDNVPYSFDNALWACLSQKAYCDALGISKATLRRYISKPPFVRDTVTINKEPVTLVRTGEQVETPRITAKRMAKTWRSILGRNETPKDFGCLVGLAQTWPEGYQNEILRTVLKNWPDFMAGVDCAVIDEQIDGLDTKKMQFKYPHLPTILRFSDTAFELFMMAKQADAADFSLI